MNRENALLSLNTGAFPSDQWLEALEWSNKLAIDGIELSPDHAIKIWSDRDIRKTAQEIINKNKINLLSVHAWKHVEGLDEVCPFTNAIGSKLVVVHCSHDAITKQFEEQVKILRFWQEWCKSHDLILTVENSSFQPLEPFVELFSAVNGLKMTLDVKHAYKPERLGLTHKDYIAALGDRIANLHLSGIDRARDELGDGIPPGNDAVDWQLLAQELAKRKYQGIATIEWSYPDFLDDETIKATYCKFTLPNNHDFSVSQCLSAWCVKFYRDKLSIVLQ